MRLAIHIARLAQPLLPIVFFLLLAQGASATPSTGAGKSTLKSLGSTLPILGEVQFWKRPCNPAGVCGLPEAVGERVRIDATISRPERGYTLSHYRQVVDGGLLELEFNVYWKLTPEFPQGFLVFQHRVQRSVIDEWQPVAECNQWRSLNADHLFPVGVCSGYVDLPADGGKWQLGVTFYAP